MISNLFFSIIFCYNKYTIRWIVSQRNEIMALPSAQKVKTELHTFLLEGNKDITRSSWKQVYSACLGRVVGSQTSYRKAICGGKQVTPSFFDGKVFFDDKHYPAQVIGMVSKDKKTWTWGFEKPVSAPDGCFQLANEVKDIGRSWKLQPLESGIQELGRGFSAESLAVVAVGASKNYYCYCKIEEKEYDLYVAFSKVPAPIFGAVNAETFFALAAKCFPMFNVDHRVFIESLLRWNGIPYEWKVQKLVAHFDSDVELSFQEDHGIASVFAMKIL